EHVARSWWVLFGLLSGGLRLLAQTWPELLRDAHAATALAMLASRGATPASRTRVQLLDDPAQHRIDARLVGRSGGIQELLRMVIHLGGAAGTDHRARVRCHVGPPTRAPRARARGVASSPSRGAPAGTSRCAGGRPARGVSPIRRRRSARS